MKHTLRLADFPHPEGMPAISRWLSAATPPETRRIIASTPKGSQQRTITDAVTPSGSANGWDGDRRCAYGDLRLMAAIPSGSNT